MKTFPGLDAYNVRPQPQFVFDDGDVPGQCAQDTERTAAFRSSIETALRDRRDSVVLDCGAGAGLMALLAARAGASHVVAVEGNAHLARWARSNAARNGFGDRICVIDADAGSFHWPSKIPFPAIVVMEMLTTWCVSEHQLRVMKHLISEGIVGPKTVLIPCVQQCFASLANTEFHVEGIELAMPLHHWRWYPPSSPMRVEELTDRTLTHEIDFARPDDMEISLRFQCKAEMDGIANSLYLTSRTQIDHENSIGDTLALNAPIAFPLPEAITAEAGRSYDFSVIYKPGGGYEGFRATFEGGA